MHYDTGDKFNKCTSTKSSSTAAAARNHSVWSYFQVQQWVGESEQTNPENWEVTHSVWKSIFGIRDFTKKWCGIRALIAPGRRDSPKLGMG